MQTPRSLVRVGLALALAGAIAAPLTEPEPARATITAPLLLLTRVTSEPTPDGTLLRVEGSFPYAVAIDEVYPLQLFVRTTEKESYRFVCFSAVWGPMGGDDESVKKGLDEEVALALGSFATPDQDARFLALAPGSMEVLLPPDFPTGLAEAQMFVIYQEEPLFSNPLPLLVEDFDEDDEGECDGKIVEAVFRYRGGDCEHSANAQKKARCEGDGVYGAASVEVTKDEGKVSAAPSSNVQPGDLVAFTHRDGELRGDTEFDVVGANGVQSLRIHTSCSEPLAPGDRFGSFELVGIATTEDGR